MRIALASPRVASSVEEGLSHIKQSLQMAADREAEIVCFPEAYLPGLRGLDFPVAPFDVAKQTKCVEIVGEWAREYNAATILGMEWHEKDKRSIASAVISASGDFIGRQTKTQLDPTEDSLYVAGETRQLFELNGIKFGVVICHEGFRYPETVRWAARRGAKVVFHPHCTGSDVSGPELTEWGSPHAPYYEKAIMCRALENTIYFASVNYAFRYQESATSVIDPNGKCVAHLPYGEEGVLVYNIDVEKANGLLASRYSPERYG